MAVAVWIATVFGAAPARVQAAPAERPAAEDPSRVWLDALDFSGSAEKPALRKSVKGTPITIAGKVFERGVGGVGRSQLWLRLDGKTRSFQAVVGIDDVERSEGTKGFEAWVDGRLAVASPSLRKGQSHAFSVDLAGARELELVAVHGGEGSDWDRFAWAAAVFVLAPGGTPPIPYTLLPESAAAIASGRRPQPSINGPMIVGATPGRGFLHRLAVSGQGPLQMKARGLPPGVKLDGEVLRGIIHEPGRWKSEITARGPRGRARRALTIVAEHSPRVRALTPPMGWNSWNVWGMAVDEAKVRAAADTLVTSGLAAHGFSYVNIDDGWAGTRDPSGHILPNEKFGDVAALAGYVHEKGLKIGIYSSPGPRTCGGATGSFQHETKDALTFAAWGIDLLKYDWCSYDEIARAAAATKTTPREVARAPFDLMNQALRATDRDITFSICQYGRDQVWQWGADAGGNLWRTTGDIADTWVSLDGIAFAQAGKETFAGPGHWNDPDMLIVGQLGWGENLHPTRLSKNEQILHLTQWALLAAPLLIGCDMSRLDDFTLDLLTNDEVLAVDQDPLGLQGSRRAKDGRTEVWARPLADGTLAVALYNRGSQGRTVRAAFADLGLKGKQPVRDLWQRKELGRFREAFSAHVPQHGAVMVKIGKPRRSAFD
jgi:alpha-galactosidase